MRISDSSYVQSIMNNLQNLQGIQQDVQTQLSTGQRINSVTDDPTAAAKILSDQQEQRELIQYQSNTDSAQGVAQAGYDALDYLTDLSDQAASIIDYSSFDETDSAVYVEQVQSLIDDALSVANGEYNDAYLFGGTSLYQEVITTETVPVLDDQGNPVLDDEGNPVTEEVEIDNSYTASAPFTLVNEEDGNGNPIYLTDADGNPVLDSYGEPVVKQHYVYNGNEEGISVNVANGVEISPYTDGKTNQSIADFLNSMVDYKEALLLGDKDSIEATNTALADAEDGLTTAKSGLSMTQYRLELVENRNSAAYNALGNNITSLREVDLNEASVKMLNVQNAYSAALTTTSSILGTSLLDYV